MQLTVACLGSKLTFIFDLKPVVPSSVLLFGDTGGNSSRGVCACACVPSSILSREVDGSCTGNSDSPRGKILGISVFIPDGLKLKNLNIKHPLEADWIDEIE